ncbi:PHA/PHB synthase family protein [Alteriqipengyuania lutimaris]|uniref:Class I poly(R)-hydroxyalkanoic acid synthase n=1 Tax=Alteriqipengyuania lutimaris TaxID=1538146 RepID=A0A395LJ45_9SPHN|nr:class I poly(R)-hydroxyalkanoic acid synthase [Alteriqipengyuania lutimaris]MBB3034847.1 polyhydroxyalkanoate synthase [Alteriqipengyuania lutimaris]RDS76317.1 class I poly(R)-hydroxyalkanoic acid synthase [Alteriqipengyuania lutimaris]
MADKDSSSPTPPRTGTDPFGAMLEAQARWTEMMFAPLARTAAGGENASSPAMADLQKWTENATRLQTMWIEFCQNHALEATSEMMAGDPAKWFAMFETWAEQLPFADPAEQQRWWAESAQLWQALLSPQDQSGAEGELPREDRRFADPRWREQPMFALIHQTYLMLTERVVSMVERMDHVDPAKREQLKFATQAMAEALSPANFAATNPIVLDRIMETRGDSLVRGMQNLLDDLRKGQLTHSDPQAFEVGENIATTPGHVVYETPLYQLIQYEPTTEKVLATPLVIFPPWINRFYILDLNEKKSFVRWAVGQGLTVFMVSWKSADASMKDVVWDDYIAAQIDAIDHVKKRLGQPAVHAIGYCVAGTTLAATLSILAKKGEAEKVRSATFFTAQVDFDDAGELLHFIDDQQLAAIKGIERDGIIDGRYMAATFNLLRGNDLIWNYVVRNYLLGEDHTAFDLLHWNGDVTNLPARWHRDYLRDLYRDNLLVKPGKLDALGVPIDLSRVETPTYVQAGKEDHIAPAGSVWKITHHFAGPMRFVLAGSGHIAGVVNPPEAKKYQYWINEDDGIDTLEEFRAGATEHPGSWWPDWIDWIRAQDDREIAVRGKRKPGSGAKDKVIEPAPGRYVKTR